jgi:hypothetical protein
VYGDYDHPSVVTLRRFRDQKLAHTDVGRAAIRLYYRASPAIATRLKSSTTANDLVRRGLEVLVSRVERMELKPDQPM